MKAVIYARYSSGIQREKSIEGKIREYPSLCLEERYHYPAHYIDQPFSAKTDNHPEYQDMIKDREKRLFDMVLA